MATILFGDSSFDDLIYVLCPQRGAFVSEPAILVKRKSRGSQIWSLEKLENKVIDMRDMYEERQAAGGPMMVDGSFTSATSDEDQQGFVDAGRDACCNSFLDGQSSLSSSAFSSSFLDDDDVDDVVGVSLHAHDLGWCCWEWGVVFQGRSISERTA